jgi:hypothetical protein
MWREAITASLPGNRMKVPTKLAADNATVPPVMYHRKQSHLAGGGCRMLLWSKSAAPGQCHALAACAQREDAHGCLQQILARPFRLISLNPLSFFLSFSLSFFMSPFFPSVYFYRPVFFLYTSLCYSLF